MVSKNFEELLFLNHVTPKAFFSISSPYPVISVYSSNTSFSNLLEIINKKTVAMKIWKYRE
jgi:hypothetical protein